MQLFLASNLEYNLADDSFKKEDIDQEEEQIY